MHEPQLPVPVRPLGWIIPAMGGLVQLAIGLVLLTVGIRYDDRREDPGALTWVAVSILAGPWLVWARRQWRAEKSWVEQQQLPEHRVAAMLGPLIQRHGITGAVAAIEQLAGERRSLQEGHAERR